VFQIEVNPNLYLNFLIKYDFIYESFMFETSNLVLYDF